MTIAILGAGPHGWEIGQHFEANTLDVRVAYFDDSDTRHPNLPPIRVGGNDHPWVAGAAWPQVRRQIAEAHPYAKAPWQYGQVLFAGVYRSPNALIGWHTHIGPNAVISHGCRIGNFVTVCAGAMLGGDVTIYDDVMIGINASVLHGGIEIGPGALVGAGAVVVDNVPPGAVVAGNPARIIAHDWTPRDMVAGRRGRLGPALDATLESIAPVDPPVAE